MTHKPKIAPKVQAAAKAADRDAAAFEALTAIKDHLASIASLLPELDDHVTPDEARYLREHAQAMANHLDRGGAALTARVAHATSRHAKRNTDRWYEASLLRRFTEMGYDTAERTEALRALSARGGSARISSMFRDPAVKRASQAVYRERDAAEEHRNELERRADAAEADLRRRWGQVGAEAVLGPELASRLPLSGKPCADASDEYKSALEACLDSAVADLRTQILGA